MTRTTIEKDLWLTGVMSKVSVSRRSNLDMGEVGDGRSDASMDVSMEIAPAATLIAAETVSANTFEPIERNGNGMRRKRSKALATPLAPNDWMSRQQRTMRQQAQELTQLHQTVGHVAYLLVAQATHKESQLYGMMTSMGGVSRNAIPATSTTKRGGWASQQSSRRSGKE